MQKHSLYNYSQWLCFAPFLSPPKIGQMLSAVRQHLASMLIVQTMVFIFQNSQSMVFKTPNQGGFKHPINKYQRQTVTCPVATSSCDIMKSSVKANSREGQEITHVLHVKFIPLISINNLEDFWICSKINIGIISVDCQNVMQHELVNVFQFFLSIVSSHQTVSL